jgi:hypothetical protein
MKIKGINYPEWLRNDIGYGAYHSWLRLHHGKATKCENKLCVYPRVDSYGKVEEKPRRYEWALIKGKVYSRSPEDYMQLCVSCHRRYDFTEEIRRKMSEARVKNPTLYWKGRKRPNITGEKHHLWKGGQRTNNKKEYYQLYYKLYYKSETYLKAREGYVLKAKEKRRALRDLLKEKA